MEYRLFPVRIVMACTCGWRMGQYTADNLGGLDWILTAGLNTHRAERRACELKPHPLVVTDEKEEGNGRQGVV
jgi:hypothetical protein